MYACLCVFVFLCTCVCVHLRVCVCVYVCACTHGLFLPICIHKKSCRNKIFVQRHLHAKDLSIFIHNLNEKIHWKHINLWIVGMVFPGVIYGYESWTTKKAEHQRIDAFELWCLEKTQEYFGQQGDQISQSYRKSTLNIHWKDWCWSSNTLATWWREPTHWRRLWCWERLKAGGEAGNRGQDAWMASHHWLNGHEFEQTPRNSEGQ